MPPVHKIKYSECPPSLQRLAKDYYVTYCYSSDNKNYAGLECPKWDDLTVAVRDHWSMVAFRSLTAVPEVTGPLTVNEDKAARTLSGVKFTVKLAGAVHSEADPGDEDQQSTRHMMSQPRMWLDIIEFHEKFGLAYDGLPRFLTETYKTIKGGVSSLAEFRRKFLKEEYEEYKAATHRGEYQVGMPPQARTEGYITRYLDEALDALVDLVYVAMGNAYLHGFDWEEAWRRVHAANMAKVRATAPSERGGMFDIVKPIGWVAPTHLDLVDKHAHDLHLVNDPPEHDYSKTWDNSDG